MYVYVCTYRNTPKGRPQNSSGLLLMPASINACLCLHSLLSLCM